MHDKHRHPTYRYPDAFDSKTNTGRWIYQELIGEGGFGLVWRVKDAKTTVRVALKLLKTRRSRDVLLATQEVRHTKRFENLTYPPTGHTLFTKYLEDCTGFELYKDEHALLAWAEGSLWNRLSSRDVIRPKPYIVMELIYGNSVSNLLIHDTLTVEDRVHIMHQSVVALDYLWRHRCVHRDFRVHNVMWRKRQLKVVDFGLCLHHANPIYATSSNPLFRTYWREDSYWIPPEVKHKDPVCNFYKEAPASFDVYGLGVLALELILEAEVSQFLTKSQKHIEDRNIERLLPHQALSLKYITKQQVKDLALEWSFFQRLVSPRPEERPSAKAVLQFMNKRLPDGFGAPPQYPADAQNWAPQVCDAPQESTNTHPPSVAQKSSTVSRGAASRESTKTHPPSVAQKSSTAPLVKSRGSIPHYPDALASETLSVAVSKYCTQTKNVSSVPLAGPIDGTQHGTIARKAALPVLLAKSRDSITQHPTGAQNISPVPIAATRSSTLHPTGPQIFSPVPEAATTSGSTQYPTGVQKYSPVPFAKSGSSNQHPVAAQKCSSVPLAESSSSSKHPTDAPTSAASLAESSGSTHDPTGAQELPVASLATSSSSTQLPTEAQKFSTAPFATPSNCAEHPPATRTFSAVPPTKSSGSTQYPTGAQKLSVASLATSSASTQHPTQAQTFSAVPPTKSSGSTQNPTGAQTSPNASTQHPAGPVQTFSTAPVSDYTKHPPGTQKLSGVSLAASTDSSLRAFETQLSEYVDTHRVGSMFTMTTLVQHFIRDVHLRAQYVQSMLKLSDTGSPNVFRLLCMIDSTILASRTMVLDAGSRNVHQDFAPAMKRFLDHAAKLYSDDSPLSNKIRERIQRFIDTWCAHNVFTLQELGGTSATDPSVVESVNHRHDQGPENAMPDCGGGQERPLTPEKLPIVDEGASELPSRSPSLREVAAIRRPRTRRNWARSRSRSDGRRRGASELPPDDYLGSSRSPSFPSRSPLRSNGSPSRRAPSRTPSVRSPIVTPSRYEGGASLRSNGSPSRRAPSRTPSVRSPIVTPSRYEGGASLRSNGSPSRRASSRVPSVRSPVVTPSRYEGGASIRWNGSPSRRVPRRAPSVRLPRTPSRCRGGSSLRSNDLSSRRSPWRTPPVVTRSRYEDGVSLSSNGSSAHRAPSRAPSVQSPVVTPSRYEGGASLRSNGSPPRHVPSRSPSVRLSRTSSRYEGGASLRSDCLPSRRAPSRPPPARLPRAPSRYRGGASLRRARYTTSGRRKRTSRSRDALSRVPQFVSPSVSPVVTNSDASTFSRCVPPYTILLNSEHTLVRVSEGSSCSNGTAATGSRLQASNTRDAHSCLPSRSRSRSEASSRCSSVSLCETCGERLYSSGSRWSSSCGSPGRCIQSCCRDPYGSPGQKSPPRASGEDTVAVHASAHRPVIGDSRASASRRRGREELPLESPICSDTELHSTQKKTRLVGQTRRLSISPSPVSEHASVISSVCGIHDQFPVTMMDDCFPLPTLSAKPTACPSTSIAHARTPAPLLSLCLGTRSPNNGSGSTQCPLEIADITTSSSTRNSDSTTPHTRRDLASVSEHGERVPHTHGVFLFLHPPSDFFCCCLFKGNGDTASAFNSGALVATTLPFLLHSGNARMKFMNLRYGPHTVVKERR